MQKRPTLRTHRRQPAWRLCFAAWNRHIFMATACLSGGLAGETMACVVCCTYAAPSLVSEYRVSCCVVALPEHEPLGLNKHHILQLHCWEQVSLLSIQAILLTPILLLLLVPIYTHPHLHSIQTNLCVSITEPISGEFKELLSLLIHKICHHMELVCAGTDIPTLPLEGCGLQQHST